MGVGGGSGCRGFEGASIFLILTIKIKKQKILRVTKKEKSLII